MLYASPIAMTFTQRGQQICDRITAEDQAWHRNPHLRHTEQGHRHMLVRRGDKLKPIPLLELTEADLDALTARNQA